MGNSIMKTVLCKREVRILYVGLDAAGKTTLLYKLKLGEVVTTIPTIGFNVETIKHSGVDITCWDVGVRDKMRPLIRHYLPNTNGLVFVVDSSDRERLSEALDDILLRLSDEDDLRNVPVLVLANKQDLDNVMTPQEIMEAIDKTGYLKNHPWKVFGTSGIKGEGLYESLDWFTEAMVTGQKEEMASHLGLASAESKQDVSSQKKEQSKLSYFSNMVEYFTSFVVTK